MKTFYLGTHRENWLASAGVPLFISHRRLYKRKTLPRAIAPWALDSGGFTELSMFGEWRTSVSDYIAAARRYRDEIGMMEWAAPMDWMVEPWIIEGSGLSVEEHQRRTVDNFFELRGKAPDVPFAPVIQGWTESDYWRCVEMYAEDDVDLFTEPVVGVGSVCRRQASYEIERIIVGLRMHGLTNLHGFGVKSQGLERYAEALSTADSMAWSYTARRAESMPGHTHKNCANCFEFAMRWRSRLLDKVDAGVGRPMSLQLSLA